MGPDEESSSATTVGLFQGSVTLCRVEEEGRIASRRQTAIDARMASVRGALVLRIEESSVLIPESVLTAAQLFASILNTVGSGLLLGGPLHSGLGSLQRWVLDRMRCDSGGPRACLT